MDAVDSPIWSRLKMKRRTSVVAIKTVTSRPVLVLWTIVSILVTILCCWSYSQPAWTLRSSSEIGSLDQQQPTLDNPAIRRRVERAVTIQLPAEEIIIDANNNASVIPGRSAIPLVHIGLFQMCIYTQQQQPERRPGNSVTCVAHADLDYEWLPPTWQVQCTAY